MANEPDGDGNALHALLGQVPDRHHAPTRASALLSVNGRHPAPLHLWHPDYCGEVDMAISADGTWYHEGVPIKRAELWQLFAGILRREADGEYYLVTPVEKCRVEVALHPLMITDIEAIEVGGRWSSSRPSTQEACSRFQQTTPFNARRRPAERPISNCPMVCLHSAQERPGTGWLTWPTTPTASSVQAPGSS